MSASEEKFYEEDISQMRIDGLDILFDHYVRGLYNELREQNINPIGIICFMHAIIYQSSTPHIKCLTGYRLDFQQIDNFIDALPEHCSSCNVNNTTLIRYSRNVRNIYNQMLTQVNDKNNHHKDESKIKPACRK